MGRFALVSVVLVASLASACGTATPASAPSRTRASSTRLRITILPGFVANATTVQYRLTCAPPSGTVPDPEAACRRLSADPAILAVRSRCFLPDTGSNVVKGELDGRPVDIRLGNCDPDVATWARLAAALGVPAPS